MTAAEIARKRGRFGGAHGGGETSVVTRMRFATSPEETWNGLMFYEHIPGRPPLRLRLLLPVPVRAEGQASAVDDESKCIYEGGHLRKRVTHVDRLRHYGFDVVEQNLDLGGGIRLAGGAYTLRELPDGGTGVEILTRYVGSRRPRWLWAPTEGVVCHAFHRHILSAMRRALSSRFPDRPPADRE